MRKAQRDQVQASCFNTRGMGEQYTAKAGATIREGECWTLGLEEECIGVDEDERAEWVRRTEQSRTESQ